MRLRRSREEDVSGLHALSMTELRGARSDVSSLVHRLRAIKEEVEEAVRTGDVGPKPKTQDIDEEGDTDHGS